MRKRNRLMAALAAAAAVSLSVIVPATAASAAPLDPWSAIGQVSNSGTCADNVATFTVSVPTVGLDAEMEGGFSVNGGVLGAVTGVQNGRHVLGSLVRPPTGRPMVARDAHHGQNIGGNDAGHVLGPRLRGLGIEPSFLGGARR